MTRLERTPVMETRAWLEIQNDQPPEAAQLARLMAWFEHPTSRYTTLFLGPFFCGNCWPIAADVRAWRMKPYQRAFPTSAPAKCDDADQARAVLLQIVLDETLAAGAGELEQFA